MSEFNLKEEIGLPKSYWIKKKALQRVESFFGGYVPSKAKRIKEEFSKAFDDIIKIYEEEELNK